MSSPALSSSSSASSGTIKPSVDLFEDLWLQLKECHKNALHELEAKVIKLKKDRCLDAQRLEEFYGRSQQLKEVQKGLQDTIAKLEGRLLLTAVCARCAPLEEQVRKGQTELEKQRQQNERLIAEHKNEKDSLQDENRKLSKELDRLKSAEAQEETPQSSEQEEGMIPDSPLHASAMPAVNKLKRRKTDGQTKHVRYKEKPLPPLHTSLFGELNKESLEMLQGGGEVLVPNTCQMDTSQTSQGPGLDDVLVVAETCRLDIPKNKEEQGPSTPQQYKVPSRSSFRTRQGPGFSVLHPDDTGSSPSLLPHGVLHKAKRRKQDLVQEVVIEKRKKNTTTAAVSLQNNTAQEERVTTSHVCKQEPSAVHKVLSVQNGAPGAQKQDASFLSPANKTKRKSDEGRTRSVLHDLNGPLASPAEAERKAEVDQTWSIDPAAALSQYHAGSPDSPEDREDRPHNQSETVDADCTFISHSMLQGRGTHAPHTGEGSGHQHQKANDSLDEMFDTTACGEYKSYHSLTHLDHDKQCTDEEEWEEEEEVADNVQKEHCFAENPGDEAKENKAGLPTYAHVAVVRNKEERRKLKGSTCKECEIYYAHLPEEERQKKLSSCSRHRFRYIPPSTPENFWEVGFPSTQTCVERGYIKEDNNPEPRMRRRQPFNALFSPKRKEEENGLFSPKRS